MTHLEIIKKAYTDCGIIFVVRDSDEDAGYSYLFKCNEKTKHEYEIQNLDHLCRTEQFMEFENGQIASY